MKKILSAMLTMLMAASLVACSGGSTGTTTSGSSSTGSSTSSSSAAAGETSDAIATLNAMAVSSGRPEATKDASYGDVTKGKDAAQRTMATSAAMTFETLDPFYVNGIEGNRIGSIYMEKMWEAEMGTTNEVGILVKDYTVSEDGYTVEWEIYDNIYDHEGNHITAHDLEWFYKHFNEVNTTANLTSFEATGDYTGKLGLLYAYYPGFLARATMNIRGISQSCYEANPDRFRNDPVGTGLYHCIDFVSGSTATFEQTYNYWGDQSRLPIHLRAHVDVMKYDVILEQAQIQTALDTNTIQMYDISASTAEDFINKGDAATVNVLKYPASWPVVLTLDSSEGGVFHDNPNLRKAIAYAIDFDAVAAISTKGTGRGMPTFGYVGLVGYNPEWENDGNHPTYDLEKAKEYLAASGVDPSTLHLRYICNGNTDMGVVIQACLAALGIEMEVTLEDEVQYLKDRFSANLNQWDICSYGTVPSGYMMTSFYNLCNINAYDFGAIYGCKDQELHDLMMDALYDQDDQAKIDKVNEKLMEEMYYIPLYQGNNWYAAYKKIEACVTDTGNKVYPQAALFSADYDVFYNK